MADIKIEKAGGGVFLVKIAGTNRAAAERELQHFIAGRAYTRYIDHFNPNNQIIEIHDSSVSTKGEVVYPV
jgi:hypothetical protein